MKEHFKIFIKDWKQIRGKTHEFLESLPEGKLKWKPHELLGTFGMQFRHMIVSQRAYLVGIKRGRIDFADKAFDKEWETSKRKIIAALKALDKELEILLSSINPKKEIIFIDGVHGESKESISRILQFLIEHEYYHQGVLTCYGRLAGLGKFIFM